MDIVEFGPNLLEEGASAGLILHGSSDAQTQPCLVVKFRAGAAGCAGGKEGSRRGEKALGKKALGSVYNSHNQNFPNII